MESELEKLAGICDFGEEALERAKRIILCRMDSQEFVDSHFDAPRQWRDDDRKLIHELFVQAPASQSMSPQLVKRACVNIDSFFEGEFAEKTAGVKVDQALIRYPELRGVRK